MPERIKRVVYAIIERLCCAEVRCWSDLPSQTTPDAPQSLDQLNARSRP